MKKSTPLWCEDCRLVCFQTGLGKPILTLNDPNGLKNTTNVHSIHLELQMALSCQISAGKWKYVNPCLDFLGIPDQRTAYVKRQVRPGWTCVRRSSVTPDLFKKHVQLAIWIFKYCHVLNVFWFQLNANNFENTDNTCPRSMREWNVTAPSKLNVIWHASFGKTWM